MVCKIRTSKRTMQCFYEIAESENLQPFILSKLAISLSLISNKPLEESDFKTDTMGLELNRQTITAEYDTLYKSLIELYEGHHINDDDYFQKYLKAHLDRGARMLYSEYKYSKDFILALISEKKGI